MLLPACLLCLLLLPAASLGPPLSRRSLLASPALLSPALLPPALLAPPASAAPPPPLAFGAVLPPPAPLPPFSALYITLRPLPATSAPLYAAAGKVPPLASLRLPLPDPVPERVPFEVPWEALEAEYEGLSKEALAAIVGRPLVVSARLDLDGVAATRDAEDLVGRALFEGGGGVEVKMGGRGLVGRVLTRKQIERT